MIRYHVLNRHGSFVVIKHVKAMLDEMESVLGMEQSRSLHTVATGNVRILP